MTTKVATRADASNLSDPQYGYDAVLGITHASLNDNVRAYVLKTSHATQKLYWIADSHNKIVLSTYDHVYSINNMDPLSFSSANPPSAPVRESLWNNGFRFAISSTLGANEKTGSESVPKEMITFSPDGQSVILTPIWRDFILVVLTENYQWHVYQQDPAVPWSFAPMTRVDTVIHNAASNAQTQSMSASTFCVPTVALDFSHNALWNINVRPALPDSINDQLGSLATDILVAAFKDSSLPIASVANKTTPWSVSLTSYEYMINRYVDSSGHPVASPTSVQQDATTLNYLCCISGKQLPTPHPFGWNWIEANQVNPYHGVFALNRNTLRDYIEGQIVAQVKQSCVAMVPVCQPGPVFGATFTAQQSPTLEKKTGVTQVLYYNYAQAQAVDSGQAQLAISNKYTCSVDFEDDQIIIRQVGWGEMTVLLPGSSGLVRGIFMDKQYIDTYTITVNQFGGLSWSVQHQTIDNTPAEGQNPTLPLLQRYGNYDFPANLSRAMTNFKPMAWGSYTAGSPAPNFILPAGTAFSCANARFSNHQDLIVNLMYAS